MALFGNVLGIDSEDEVTMKALATNKADESVNPSPTTIASDESEPSSLMDEFDLTYRKEPQVFNSINLKVQTIMGAGHELRCKNDKNGKVLKFFNEFLEGIGEVGEESTWEEILEDIFYSEMKYGKHHIENVKNELGTRIVDLVTLDSKKMDFARDIKGSIVFDLKERPIGFTQQLPIGFDVEGKGDTPPEIVSLKPGQIFILPKKIAYFWLYGDKLDPIGLIEPGYKSIIRKQNIQEAQTNSIYQRGLFPIIDYVGNSDRFPTPKMIQNSTNKLKMMQHNRYFSFPYWHRIEALEVKQSDVVDNTIKSLKEEISASLGMPLPFSMGSGEATNRSTLKSQQQFLEYSLKDIVKKTISSIRKNIFKRISRLMKFEDNKGILIVPYIVWGEIGVESLDDKASRLCNYLKAGAITPDYVIPFVIESEELEKDPNISPPKFNEKKQKDNKFKEEKKTEKQFVRKYLSKSKIKEFGFDFTYQNLKEILNKI